MSHTGKELPEPNLQNTVRESSTAAAMCDKSLCTMPIAGAPSRNFLATEMERRIRALRDIYKDDVQETRTESAAPLQQKRRKMQQEVGKTELLRDYSKNALHQLAEQRTAIDNALQSTKANVESLHQQLDPQKNARSLALTRAALERLLPNSKRNN